MKLEKMPHIDLDGKGLADRVTKYIIGLFLVVNLDQAIILESALTEILAVVSNAIYRAKKERIQKI